jgi:hypothetical protein
LIEPENAIRQNYGIAESMSRHFLRDKRRARVYETLFEMNAMSRVEESPTGKVLVNDESLDKSDPKHLEALKHVKEMHAFRFEHDIKQELPDLPADELAYLLSIRPNVRFRGSAISSTDLSTFLSLEDLPVAYRVP